MSLTAMVPLKKDQPFQMVIRKGGKPQEMAAHWTVGIIMRGYPARFGGRGDGRRKYADPDAMNRFGQALWITLHNICLEVARTHRDSTIEVRWKDDGSPSVKVITRLIYVPD